MLLKDKDATKDALEAKAEALGKASQKLGEVMYAQAQAAAVRRRRRRAAAVRGGAAARREATSDEKVVDAEFTEVKDKK